LTSGVIDWPAVVFEGWTLKASLLAAPAEMLNALLVALVSPRVVFVAVRVYPVPALSIEMSLNVATPVDPEPLCVVVPLSVPEPGFDKIESWTGALHVVPDPPFVWIATVMLGVIGDPAAVVEG
jgi:hypothetical protein